VTVSSQPRSSREVARLTLLVVASAVCLTLLFSAQDAMRRRLMGGSIVWSQVIAINALDWLTWGLLLPFIVVIGRRIRLDDRRRRTARVIGWLLLAVAFCIVQSLITGLVIRSSDARLFGIGPVRGGRAVPLPLGAYLLNWGLATSSLDLLIFGMTAAAFHAVLYYRDLRIRQLRESDLQARLARSELNVLRLQLQPHFLFNALHTVSSLMLSDVPTAQRVISALGDLLRTSLDHTARQETPLHEELAFVQRYLDIQRARFRQRLTVHIDAPAALSDALVPSLVLQPLVENAIRHGIEPSANGGAIWISARQSDRDLVLTVTNDGEANDSSGMRANGGGGVGLANVAARLTQLYDRAHRFEAGWSEPARFRVMLMLPYHTDATLFPAAKGGSETSR
jgi:two-component sensor histidine kinase